MKNYLSSLPVIYILLAYTGCSSSVGQQDIPADIVAKTDNYIISRTGKDFFGKYFSLDNDKSAVDSPYITVVYRFHSHEKPYIDETVTILTDFEGNIDGNQISGIPDCAEDTLLCSFNISEEDALRIAEENGLEKGMKKWKADFKWDNVHKRYVWVVNSVLAESEGTHGYRGNGWQIIIDPAAGEVIDKKEWFVR